MNVDFIKTFIKNFSSDFIENDIEINLKENGLDKFDHNSIYMKVLSLVKKQVDISESHFQDLFESEFYTMKELLKDARSQQLKYVCYLIPQIADIIIAKRILVSLNKIVVQKEHSKLVYRMH